MVAAGDSTFDADAGAYRVDNTVVYFALGTHMIQIVMFTGHDSVYIGVPPALAPRPLTRSHLPPCQNDR
ncbi:MAG: hypothetical protein ACM3ML_13820 [Micromonosporaceae bacterium]